MDIYTTEKEQIEQLKYLWKTYGIPTIVGVVVALIGNYFWNVWNNHQEKNYESASLHYQQMLFSRNKKDSTEMNVQANYLINHFAKTDYAQLAALFLAKEAVEQKHYSEAKDHLLWVTEHSKNKTLEQIAKTRLERIKRENP